MPCYHPLQAWRGPRLKSGKRAVVFSRGDAERSLLPFELSLPCGQCIGCRLERSRQWAMRCVHEASLHEDNCFVTLTYDNSHLPPGGSLLLRDWQLFIKRLRKSLKKKFDISCVVNMVRNLGDRIFMRVFLAGTLMIAFYGLLERMFRCIVPPYWKTVGGKDL